MRNLMEWGFWAAWVLFMVVWAVAAGWTKAAARSSSRAVRRAQSAAIIVGYLLICDVGNLGWLNQPIWEAGLTVVVTGLAMTWAGILFAIWARAMLGRNWSGMPQVQESHELITRGPYGLTRHPIYTGMLLATLGTALASAMWRSAVGFVVIAAALAVKIGIEERLMEEIFPAAYPEYRLRVKAVVPWIL